MKWVKLFSFFSLALSLSQKKNDVIALPSYSRWRVHIFVYTPTGVYKPMCVFRNGLGVLEIGFTYDENWKSHYHPITP